MSGAQTSLALQDRLTGPLQRMISAMDQTIRVMERMNTTTNNIDMRSLGRARTQIQNANADLERLMSASRSTGAGLAPVSRGFQNIGPPANSATNVVRNFFASFAGAAVAYLSIQGIANGFKSFVNASDNYVSINARLANVNDGLQTQAQLQDQIYQAAQRSRLGYNDMASSVAKLNLLAGDAFKGGNKEAIRFGELMGKAFTVSGASTQERQAGMYQLTQAMAAGKLQGDEFRSIMENAPLLAKSIADFTGKSMGSLKEMSAEGTITADIIKNALFKAGDDIEKKFKNMPLTFSQAWTMFSNWSLRAFEPLFVRFNQFVNSNAFAKLAGDAMWFVNVFTAGMDVAFDTLQYIYTEIHASGAAFRENWSTIGPILSAVGGALLGYLGIMGAIKIASAYAAISQWALNTAVSFHAAAAFVSTGATFAQTAAQYGLNAAMYAFPGTWILLVFLALIGFVVYAMITWADTTAAVVGFISGLFAALGAFLWNIIANVWNLFAMFAEFLINLFIDPTYAVKKLFYDLAKLMIDNMAAAAGSFDTAANALAQAFVSGANIAIGAVNGLISALNKIPGVNIGKIGKLSASTAGMVSTGLKIFANNLKAPTTDANVVKVPRMDLANMPGAFNVGNALGKTASLTASNKLQGLVDKAKGIIKGPNSNNPFKGSPGEAISASPGVNNPVADGGKGKNPTGGKLDKIGKIEDKINIADEDIKMLRDLAEIKSIQNFVTLTPTVNMQTGDIRNEVDVDKVVAKIEKKMIDEVARSAEGVYK